MSARQYGVRLTLASTSPVPSYNVAPFVSGVLSLASHEDFGNGDETFTAGYLLSCSDIADRVDIAQGGNYAQIGDTTIELTNAGGVLATLEAAGVSLYGAKVEILSLVAPATATVRWIGIVVDQSWQGAKIELRVESVLTRKHKLIPENLVTAEQFPRATESTIGKAIPMLYGTIYEGPALPTDTQKKVPQGTGPSVSTSGEYWLIWERYNGVTRDDPERLEYAPGTYDSAGPTVTQSYTDSSPINRPFDIAWAQIDSLLTGGTGIYIEVLDPADLDTIAEVAKVTAIAFPIVNPEGADVELTLEQPLLNAYSSGLYFRVFNQSLGFMVSGNGDPYPVPEDPNAVIRSDGVPIAVFEQTSGDGFAGINIPARLQNLDSAKGRIWIPANITYDTYLRAGGGELGTTITGTFADVADEDFATFREYVREGSLFAWVTVQWPDLSMFPSGTITSAKLAWAATLRNVGLTSSVNVTKYGPDNTETGYARTFQVAGANAYLSGGIPANAGFAPYSEASMNYVDETQYAATAIDLTEFADKVPPLGFQLQARASGTPSGGEVYPTIRWHEIGYCIEYDLSLTSDLYWTGWQTEVGTPTATNAGVSICATATEVLYANKICIDPTASDSDVRNNVVPTVDEASAEAADTDLAQINGEAYEVESFNSNVCRIQLDSQINSADFLAMVARDWNLIIAPDATGAEVFTAFLRDMGSNTYAYSATDSDMVEGSIAGVDLTAIEDLVNEPIVRFDYSSRQGLTRAVRIRSIETDPATLTATNYTQYVTGVGDFSTALAVFQILHQSWQRYGFKAQGEFEKKTVPYLQDRYSPQGGLYSDTLSINYEPIRTTLTAAVGTSWLEWVSSRKKILSFTVLESQSAAAAPLGSRFRVSHFRYTAGSYVYGTLAERIWNPTDGTCTLSVMLDPTPYTAATLVYRDTLDASFDTARDTLNASLDTLQDSLGA